MANATKPTVELPDNLDEILEQLQEVQLSGDCNMFHRTCVQRAAYEMMFYELVNFMHEVSYDQLLGLFSEWLREQRDD